MSTDRPNSSQRIRLAIQAQGRADDADNALRAAQRKHDKHLTDFRNELREIWEQHPEELVGPDGRWLFHHIVNTLGIFGPDVQAKIDELSQPTAGV